MFRDLVSDETMAGLRTVVVRVAGAEQYRVFDTTLVSRSRVVRKLIDVEGDLGVLNVDHYTSSVLVEVLRKPATVVEFLKFHVALDYFMIELKAVELLYFVNDLLVKPTFKGLAPVKADYIESRTELVASAGALPSGTRLDTSDIGYEVLQYIAEDELMDGVTEHEDAPVTEDFVSFVDILNRQRGRSTWASRRLDRVIRVMASRLYDTRGADAYVIQHYNKLGIWSTARFWRHCLRRERQTRDFFIPLGWLRATMSDRRLPLMPARETEYRLLPGGNDHTKGGIVESDNELMAVIDDKSRWLAGFMRTWSDVFVTGSFLLYAVTGNGCPGDIDVITTPDRFEEKAANLVAIFQEIADRAGGVRRVIARNERKITMVIEGATSALPWDLSVDMYVNSTTDVANYHLPCVRMAMSGSGPLLIHPSCAIALRTGVNLDYKHVCGKKHPYDIIMKYNRAGYNILLNRCEQHHIVRYLTMKGDLHPPMELKDYAVAFGGWVDTIEDYKENLS